MRYKWRKIKVKIATLLIVAMSINSFGAIVTDNDGSAFVTKAEFEALKNSFRQQIDTYNLSIDGKIDGAIASYLNGIQLNTSEIAQTGLTLDGYNKSVCFIGPNFTGFNNTKEPWSRDIIYVFGAKTYAATYIAVDETYNYLSFLGYSDYGDSNKKNFLIYRDVNGYIRGAWQNCTSTYTRNIVAWSGNYAQFGGAFTELGAQLAIPVSPTIDPSTDVILGKSYGFSNRKLPYSGQVYTTPSQLVYYYGDVTNRPAKNPDGTYTPPPAATASTLNGSKWNLTRASSMRIADKAATCTWNYQTRTGAFTFKSTPYLATIHFPKGSSTQYMCLDYEYGEVANIATVSSTLMAYTVSKKLDIISGIMANSWQNWRAAHNPAGNRYATLYVNGYGLKFKYKNYDIDEIFYPSSAALWGINNSLGKGFLFYYSDINTGTLEFDIKVRSNPGSLWFKNSSYDVSDTTSDTNLISFEYSIGTAAPVETKRLTLQKDKTYHIKIKYNKNNKLYMFPVPSSDTSYLNIDQVGDAIFIKE